MTQPDSPIHSNFEAVYEHTNRDTGEKFSAPFPAAVFGLGNEFFGVGRVIGNIDDNPVIEVQDRDTGEPAYVMGYESWWTAPVPEEVVEHMSSGRLAIDSIAAYRQKQDDYWKTVDMGDDEFLNDAGIDTSASED